MPYNEIIVESLLLSRDRWYSPPKNAHLTKQEADIERLKLQMSELKESSATLQEHQDYYDNDGKYVE